MLIADTDARTLSAWSREYVLLSNLVDQYRSAYVGEFQVLLQTFVKQFLPDDEVSIKYQRGWDDGGDLDTILRENFKRDCDRRFTFYGPQRAELFIRFNRKPAKDVASRGQKKLITFALHLSQAKMQQNEGRQEGLLLIDDLPSELDMEHRNTVINLLFDLSVQVVLSCIEINKMAIDHGRVKKMFHVKRGYVREVI